jgi:hypothetical protein
LTSADTDIYYRLTRSSSTSARLKVSEPIDEEDPEIAHIKDLLGVEETIEMSTVSKKRKLDEPTKYYAVRAGFKPGVYMTWAECVENTTGFKGASCRSSPSHS